MYCKHLLSISAAAAALFTSGTAIGATNTATGTLSVSAIVANSCTVASTPLLFATIDASTETSEATPAAVSVTCTATQSNVTVSLGGGSNASGGQRHMANGNSDLLPYALYSDAAHSSSVGVDGTVFSGSLGTLTKAFNVYGTVPAGAYPAGTYTDSVLVTLNY